MDEFKDYKGDVDHYILSGLTGSGDYARVLDPRTFVTGERAWDVLAGLSRGMLAPSLDLLLWRDLGGAVGAARLSFAAGDTEKVDFRLGEIGRCVENLAIDERFSFLRELATRAGLLGSEDRSNTESVGTLPRRASPSDLQAFDEALRERLAKLPSTKPLLHLQIDKLIFFGQQYSFGGRNKSEIACLWLLAEQVPEAVERDEMMEQGRIRKDVKRMDEVMCRLRRGILKRLLEDLRDRTGRKLSPYEQKGDCYIRAVDIHRSGGLLCPYKLELDPARVRVDGPRPPWMKPADVE